MQVVKQVCKYRLPCLALNASRVSSRLGQEGKGKVGLWCPWRRERADVPGVGSSEAVAWGGEIRLLFSPCCRSRIGKEWRKEGALGILLLSRVGYAL